MHVNMSPDHVNVCADIKKRGNAFPLITDISDIVNTYVRDVSYVSNIHYVHLYVWLLLTVTLPGIVRLFCCSEK